MSADDRIARGRVILRLLMRFCLRASGDFFLQFWSVAWASHELFG